MSGRETGKEPSESELDFSDAELVEMNADVAGREAPVGDPSRKRRRSIVRVPADNVRREEAEPRPPTHTEPSLPAFVPPPDDPVEDAVEHAFSNGGFADRAVPALLQLIGPEPEEVLLLKSLEDEVVEDPDTDPRALAEMKTQITLAPPAPPPIMQPVDDEPTAPLVLPPPAQAPAQAALDPSSPMAALVRAVATPAIRPARADETPMEIDGAELEEVEHTPVPAVLPKPPIPAGFEGRSLTPPPPLPPGDRARTLTPMPPPMPAAQEAASQGAPAAAPASAPATPPAAPPVPSPAAAPAVAPTPPAAPPAAELPLRTRKRRRAKQWFEEIFDDDYLRTLPSLTQRKTEREAGFIAESLGLPAGGRVLDLGCGSGRHAMNLAERGYQVTGLDLSLPLLIRAADSARRASLNINFIHGDMREMTFEDEFDGAYCMFTSFGYFDDDTNRKVAANLARAIKPGGKLLVDVVNRDYLCRDLPTRVWWQGEGCVILEEVDFNYFSSRLQVQRSIIFEDGRQVEQEISIRAYSLHEIGKVLHHSGFRVTEVSGGLALRGKFFGAQSRQLIVLAEKKTP